MEVMIIVIIAGGSGTRLWPLSTPEYPKHLLQIADESRSLLQRTYDRAKQLCDTIYVVSETSHINHVKAQLPDLAEDHFIVEPARRGTAHCIIAALAHIQSRHDPDEPIVSIPADHYIRDIDGFIHSFRVATAAAHAQQRLTLVGVEPSYPSTGFGYIEKGPLLNEDTFVYNVARFKEKPDHQTAQGYLETGNYLWNCGYFVGSLKVYETAMERFSPTLFSNYQRLLAANTSDTFEQAYLTFETAAIDYVLIEQVDNLLVAPASFDWMDVGSFADMHTAVATDELGNSVTGTVQLEEVQNSLIQNHESKPVAVIGLDNVVVINTVEGILVSRKDLSQKVGEVSKRFKTGPSGE